MNSVRCSRFRTTTTGVPWLKPTEIIITAYNIIVLPSRTVSEHGVYINNHLRNSIGQYRFKYLSLIAIENRLFQNCIQAKS